MAKPAGAPLGFPAARRPRIGRLIPEQKALPFPNQTACMLAFDSILER